jgi:hypothetical protein
MTPRSCASKTTTFSPAAPASSHTGHRPTASRVRPTRPGAVDSSSDIRPPSIPRAGHARFADQSERPRSSSPCRTQRKRPPLAQISESNILAKRLSVGRIATEHHVPCLPLATPKGVSEPRPTPPISLSNRSHMANMWSTAKHLHWRWHGRSRGRGLRLSDAASDRRFGLLARQGRDSRAFHAKTV